jgi:hypothetical protein
MTRLPFTVVAAAFAAALAFAIVLDALKMPVFRRLKIT